jgi:hypothetical protein
VENHLYGKTLAYQTAIAATAKGADALTVMTKQQHQNVAIVAEIPPRKSSEIGVRLKKPTIYKSLIDVALSQQ